MKTLEDYARQALERMHGDRAAAVQLLLRWGEKESDVRRVLWPAVDEALQQAARSAVAAVATPQKEA